MTHAEMYRRLVAGTLKITDVYTLPPKLNGPEAVCEICEQPLDDSAPWQRGLDGCAAHESCLAVFLAAD
jgi:hypothetical protein